MTVDTRILLRLMLRGAVRTAGLLVGVYGVYKIAAGDISGGRMLLALTVFLVVLSHPLVFRVLAHALRLTAGTLRRHVSMRSIRYCRRSRK